MSVVKIKTWLTGLCVLALVGCGGGNSSDAGTPLLSDTGSGSGSGGGTPTVTVALAVQLIDANGAATTAVVVGQPVRARAVLTRNGTVVSGELVQFLIDQSIELAKLDPTSGSQLTDDSGAATVSVSSVGANAGAGRVTATATVGGVAATGSANFFASGSVGSQPSTLTLGVVKIGSTSVSAYGTTSVEVPVLQNGQTYSAPVAVSFTSSCAAGKSTITPSATTQPNGVAVATFVDNGCAQTADANVTITATIGTDTKSSSMVVKAPTAGSLRFVSAVPADKSITLRGQGGNGRQENALLTFKLVDVAGNGVGDADVCFEATTYVGGLNLDGFNLLIKPTLQGSTTLCGADAAVGVRYVKRTSADGTVAVQINSGNVPTPVRVRARTLYPATTSAPLETFSDTLSISTGLPLQRSFSLSVDKANIDGGSFDGEVAKLTVRLADQFSNPVPDGTVVNFVASGGAVCTADNGSCKTVNGGCSCDFISQARRPMDGRVVVTAYAIGLEDFDDNNGNNQYDSAVDKFYDLGDGYVDANKDGLPSSITTNGDTDILIPYDLSKGFQKAGDSVRGTAHIRASTIIYLGQSSSSGDPTVVLPLAQLSQERNLLGGTGAPSSYFVRLAPICPQGSPVPQATLSMVLDDGVGNPMAAGTVLSAADASDNVAPAAFRPSTVLAFGARSPSTLIDLPNMAKTSPWTLLDAKGSVVTPHSVIVRGVADKCTGNASFSLDVASPRGGKAAARVLYDGEARTLSRFGFDVRYRNPNLSLSVGLDNADATINVLSLVHAAAESNVTAITVDWGDGTVQTTFDATLLVGSQTHTYAAGLGSSTIRVTVTTAADSSYSATQTVNVP